MRSIFELSIAYKYLLPRRKQLSASLIGLISLFVISLVVWLILVFFSVTSGLEKSWLHKLTLLTAPVRLTPTDAYYHSYYYQIDAISDASDYSLKTIAEKKASSSADPYDPLQDQEIPYNWPVPDRNDKGDLKDLVGLAYQAIQEINQVGVVQAQDFELTASHVKLDLIRQRQARSFSGWIVQERSYLSYPVYLAGFESSHDGIRRTLLPPNREDVDNFFRLIGIKDNPLQEHTEEVEWLPPAVLQFKLKTFLEEFEIRSLKISGTSWLIPLSFFSTDRHWKGYGLIHNGEIQSIVLPMNSADDLELREKMDAEHHSYKSLELTIEDKELWFYEKRSTPQRQKLAQNTPLLIFGTSEIDARLDAESLQLVTSLDDLSFQLSFMLQGNLISGQAPFRGLKLGRVDPLKPYEASSSLLLTPQQGFKALPHDSGNREGVLLPKNFRDAGVLLGDQGSLNYISPSPSTLQELTIPIFVAGFYDPGMIPVGGKFLFANKEVTRLIRSSMQSSEAQTMTNGINIHFADLSKAGEVKHQLTQSLKRQGIAPYWHVETFEEYEFTKPIIQELHSQRNLFLLIATVMIIVACSNIISMLIILVNDKKKEIGILRSMGASTASIAAIFSIAGAIIGLTSSALGIGAGLATLSHLSGLIQFLSALQGHEMLSAAFYGQELPHHISGEALFFVVATTAILSIGAAFIPAYKACQLNPSEVLKSTGD